MRFKPLGFRPKLILTAIGVTTILYALLGAAVQIKARTAILGSVDFTLREMAGGFQRFRDGRHGPPGPRGPFDAGGPPQDDHDFDHHDHRRGPPELFSFLGVVPSHPPNFPSDSMRPGIPSDDADIHETRPRIVWRDKDAGPMPFPVSKPTDEEAVVQERAGAAPILRTVLYEDQPVRVITVAIRSPNDNHIEAVAQINYWLGDIYKTLDSLTATLILILPLGMLLMGAASTYVVGKTLKPIRNMTSAAAIINAAELNDRLEVVGHDEFSELASTMNGMFGRLEIAFAEQAEALARVQEVLRQQRRFTSDASHELKTPLAVVKVNASLLKSCLQQDPDGLESLEAIDLAVNRMSKLVQDLLLLARTDAAQLSEQFAEVDLISLADQAATLVPCSKRVHLSAPSEPIVVDGSQFALERLLTNLLDNACRHSDASTPIELKLSRINDRAVIEIVDYGEGIPKDDLAKIFDRFHRVDGSRHSGTGGAGLGLAICKGIVGAHCGNITVKSELNVGTTFRIDLPLLEV